MGFRDDEESRRAKVDALLAQRTDHEDRIEGLEARLETLEAKAQEQEARIAEAMSLQEKRVQKSAPAQRKGKAKKKQPPGALADDAADFQRRWRLAFGLGGLVIGLLGAGMYFAMISREPPPPAPEPPEEPVPVSVPETPPMDMIGDENVEVPPAVEESPPFFSGQVSLVEGPAGVAEGSRCEVHADSVDPLLYRQSPDGLSIRCGGETLYRFDARAPCTIAGQGEIFGGLFTFSCEDRGIREDRPEMQMRSVDRSLRIWSDAHGWNVVITLEQRAARVVLRRSFDRRGGLPLPARVSLNLRVQESVGDGAPPEDTQLTLEVRTPRHSRIHNCEVTLRRGRRVLGEGRGRCFLDEDLSLIGIEAGLSERRQFGVTMERGEATITLQRADDERTWRATAIIEPE